MPLTVTPLKSAKLLNVALSHWAEPLKVAPRKLVEPLKVAPTKLAVSLKAASTNKALTAEGRRPEVSNAAEGCLDEAGIGHYATFKFEVDESGASEIEADARPETWARRIGGALILWPGRHADARQEYAAR